MTLSFDITYICLSYPCDYT